MKDILSEIRLLVSDIILCVGGVDNINGITSGKKMLLSISVHHKKYVNIKKLERISSIVEVISGPKWITILLDDIDAHEVEMVIRLYEKEESRKVGDTISESEPLIERIFIFLQQIFTPLLSVLLAAGILQAFIVIAISFGFTPHLYTEESILTTISGAFYYFIPVLVAFSTANYYKTNPYIAVTVAGILLHPTIATFINDSVLNNFMNIQIVSGQFSNSLLPILLLGIFQAKLDKIMDEKLTKTITTIFKPFILLASSVFIGVFFLGPLMTLLGNALIAAFTLLLNLVPWVATGLMGAFGPIFVMMGAHYSLFPLIKQSVEATGYETLLGPGMLMMYAAHAGVALGVTLTIRKKVYKAYSGTAFLLALLGVSQPVLYGVEILLKKPFIYAMIAGGTGGLFAGLMEVKAFGYVNPGLIALPRFQGETSNLFSALIGMVISFSISFFLCRRAYSVEPADRDLESVLKGQQKKEDRFS